MLCRRQCAIERAFCTTIHSFAQSFRQNLIDALRQNFYLAHQIEPRSLRTLRLSFEDVAA